MKIPITPKPIIRETTCPWEYMDEDGKGDLQTAEITIQYLGQTIAQAKAYQAEMETLSKTDPDAIVYPLIDALERRLHRLPDILGDKKVTREFLENQDLKNLNAAIKAIADADNPEKK